MIEIIDEERDIRAEAERPIDARRLFAIRAALAERPDVDLDVLAAALMAVEVELVAAEVLGDEALGSRGNLQGGLGLLDMESTALPPTACSLRPARGVLTDGRENDETDDVELGGEGRLRLLRR